MQQLQCEAFGHCYSYVSIKKKNSCRAYSFQAQETNPIQWMEMVFILMDCARGFRKLITESMSLITLESFLLVFCVKVLKNVTTWL